MGKICLCLTGKTLAQNLEILDKNRAYVDIAELRVDCLDPDERFLLRRFPGMAGIPVILTVRRAVDGGSYFSGEASRITLLAKGLAYADADRRRNFAYVDLEEDLDVPSLEEAARAFGTRIIRSWHNTEGVDENLAGKLRKLRRIGDEIAKAALTPRHLDDVRRVYHAARETTDVDKILYCMGEYGANTGILAEHLGSRISYTFPAAASDAPPAPGQMEPRELAELYRFHEITDKTKIFAITGYPLTVSSSCRFFNAIFKIEQTDAVYVPIPADSIQSMMRLAGEIGISGLSVTMPYKEDALSCLKEASKEVLSIGACNTIVTGPNGWAGYNTDAASFSGSLLQFIGRKDLRGRKLTIIGAGGCARAVAAEVYRLKGKALVLNRTVARARALAEPYRFAWAGLDSRGADLMEKYSGIIIQASSVGMTPNADADPIAFYKFSGREIVMDVIYKPEKTACLRRAEEAGCRILNGHAMLLGQLRQKYTYFVNKEFPPSLISRVGV
ncbi:MAG: type I 3-dehydroquinate dehydratase [Treponema sp.]|nr:type I 3-dehydroquinate dehydratase [Treponema sp.]